MRAGIAPYALQPVMQDARRAIDGGCDASVKLRLTNSSHVPRTQAAQTRTVRVDGNTIEREAPKTGSLTGTVISRPATILEDLGLCLFDRITVTDCGEGRHLHDCSLATVRTTPPRCQRGSRLGAVATRIGMLHWRHPPSNFVSTKISHPEHGRTIPFADMRATFCCHALIRYPSALWILGARQCGTAVAQFGKVVLLPAGDGRDFKKFMPVLSPEPSPRAREHCQ
jgi:hypothetical protein